MRLALGEVRRLLDGPLTQVVGDGQGGATGMRWLQPSRWAWANETLGEHGTAARWAADLLRPELPPPVTS